MVLATGKLYWTHTNDVHVREKGCGSLADGSLAADQLLTALGAHTTDDLQAVSRKQEASAEKSHLLQ